MTSNEHKELLKEILAELKALNAKMAGVTTITFNFSPQQECEHDYPAVWHGTVPPCCSKCGKPAQMMLPNY